MHFNVSSLIFPVDPDILAGLGKIFTKDEIDQVVKDLDPDHSLGPNGFNRLSWKKCWHLVAKDFYCLCSDFCDNLLNIQSINSSFITLIPKKPNPLTVNDYRPISPLNSSLKLLTKLVANRL